MQADSDLEKNETESRVDHVSGHVEDPGDQAAGPLHAQYGSLYSFYLHPMAVVNFLLVCPCVSTSVPALPFPCILFSYLTFAQVFILILYDMNTFVL
jgi:hypothetical protein